MASFWHTSRHKQLYTYTHTIAAYDSNTAQQHYTIAEQNRTVKQEPNETPNQN